MFPLETLEDFFAKSGPIHYKKGATILHGGDEPRGVYFLKKGYVRLFSISNEAEELTLVIFKPQDFFPMIWALNGSTNFDHFEAMTPVEVYRVPRAEFIQFLKEHPDVFSELVTRILIRMSGLYQRMQYLAFGKAHSKVASILYICAERFGKKTGSNVVIDVPLTHKDIANLVGMTRETVSIEMKKLAQKGVISYKGKVVTVHDLVRLKEESLFDED